MMAATGWADKMSAKQVSTAIGTWPSSSAAAVRYQLRQVALCLARLSGR